MAEKLFSGELNMTLEEMENEIIGMRRFEEYLMRTLGKEQYDFLVHGFAREVGKEKLMDLGASEEVAEKIMDSTDIEFKVGTKKM